MATYKLTKLFSIYHVPFITVAVSRFTWIALFTSSMSQGMLRIVKTPDGKIFRIENDNTGKWLLNRKRAIKTSDEPHPCYRNPEVEICFDE